MLRAARAVERKVTADARRTLTELRATQRREVAALRQGMVRFAYELDRERRRAGLPPMVEAEFVAALERREGIVIHTESRRCS
jgi:hypothetical protein